ncbi:MAG: hypothetical protein M1813_001474 [Trichoglossum hirsutum]|nr:MAG: hypothetical protein M1813_001474 [Trichoglossum hirsutum]
MGVRFPADGSAPQLLSLTTTSAGVRDGPDCFLFHVPDLRTFWKVPRAWKYRDLERITLGGQPNEKYNGVYMKFISFAMDDLPENKSIPACFYGAGDPAAGDVFLVKLAPQEFGEHGWAIYEDIPPEFLELPCTTRGGSH